MKSFPIKTNASWVSWKFMSIESNSKIWNMWVIQNSHLSTKRLKLPLVPHTSHLDPNIKYLIHTSGTRTFRTAMLSNWMPNASGRVMKSSSYINQQGKYFSLGTYPKLVGISTRSLGNIVSAQFKNFSSDVASETMGLIDKPRSSKIFGSVNATDQKMFKSPLKWVGGKRRVCSKLISQFPQDLTHYREPFVGGGSVLLIFLHYKQKGFFPKCEKVYASDANANLINFWKLLKDYPEELFNETQKLLSEYQKLPDFKLSNLQVGSEAKLANAPRDLLGLSVSHTDSQGKVYLTISEIKEKRKPTNLQEANFCRETFYYWIRTQYNINIAINSASSDPKGSPERGAFEDADGMTKLKARGSCPPLKDSRPNAEHLKLASYFLFLNKTCFRGLYREGPFGFNVPYGHYKNPGKQINLKDFIEISNLIQEVIFYHGDYRVQHPCGKLQKDCFSEPLSLNARGSCPGSVALTDSKVLNFFYLDPPYVPLKNTSFTKYIHPNLISTPKISNLQSKFGMRSVSSEGNPPISSLTTFSSKQSHLNFFSYVESLIKMNTNFQTLRVPWRWPKQSFQVGVPPTRQRSFQTRSFQNPLGIPNTSCSVALTETEFSESGDSKSGGETHLKDTPSETKVFSQPMFINGLSITTQFLITNSNTPLVNDWADTLNLKKEMYTSKRAIHSKDPNSVASELIIRNYRISLSTYKVKKSKPDTLS